MLYKYGIPLRCHHKIGEWVSVSINILLDVREGFKLIMTIREIENENGTVITKKSLVYVPIFVGWS